MASAPDNSSDESSSENRLSGDLPLPVDEQFANSNSKTSNEPHSDQSSFFGLLMGNGPFSKSSIEDSGKRRDGEFFQPGAKVGRYRIGQVLGQGGYGVVYLAEDVELQRTVALKAPFAELSSLCDEAKRRYLKEARLLAQLDHPHILPIYDVVETEDGLAIIVSKFISGCSLGERMRLTRLSITESAYVVMKIAEALAYAHDHQLVHRDIKPGNIALEHGEKPYLIDFGLAETESDLKNDRGLSGTPSYMSPEQARGESHLIDSRSDIYSLGVVFFELLTGELPHEGDGIIDLLMNISRTPPRLPHELDRSIPREVERIVMKCLAKLAGDRYSNARELAEDIRDWLEPNVRGEKRTAKTVKIFPKGLRSYDAADSEYYPGLLPGPLDRTGLPESLRFWKSRIEESNPTKTFRVGVIYGPSGCGKSSYVKAGLLPRLPERIRVVYAEASPEDTETQLTKGLERACPDVPRNGSLWEGLTHLRRVGDHRRKVLLVIDQFEQWLHGPKNREEFSQLAEALRQCDGERVQCVLLVRDDYWLGLSRFMRRLEIHLSEGANTGLIDLFDKEHSRNVLEWFGQAYGSLPARESMGDEQRQFVKEVVESLSQDGKVVSVRLALFAEMMRGRKWDRATLAEVGGAEGLGVTFLEETFESRRSGAGYRRHREAAKRLLRGLLPTGESSIKGEKRSREELRQISGYESNPEDFNELMQILDGDLRLITPTATEDEEGEAGHYYQLTHDYLVPSLREWLDRKRKETKRGRAELFLEEQSGLWNARPEPRRLPSLWEWLGIRRLVPRRRWSPSQAKMMRAANRYHLSRITAISSAIVLIVASAAILRNRYVENRDQAEASYLVDLLTKVETPGVPEVIRQLSKYKQYTIPMLEHRLAETPEDAPGRLHLSLAMLPTHPELAEYLYDQILLVNQSEFEVVLDSLENHQDELSERMWKVVFDNFYQRGERLRAAAVLARYRPDDTRWSKVADLLIDLIVFQNGGALRAGWAKHFRNVGNWMLPTLEANLIDEEKDETVREVGVYLLRSGVETNPGLISRFEEIMNPPLDPAYQDEQTQISPNKRANAAAALLQINQESPMRLLSEKADRNVRHVLIKKMLYSPVDPWFLFLQFEKESNLSIRRALLHMLSLSHHANLTKKEKSRMFDRLEIYYRQDPDANIHSAIRGVFDRFEAVRRRTQIDLELAKEKARQESNWFVNQLGLTMVKMRPYDVIAKKSPNRPQQYRVDRSFAISSSKISVKQYEDFRIEQATGKLRTDPELITKEGAIPIEKVTWYESAAYCNWLSEKEGIPKDQWCYLPNKDGKYDAGMQIKANCQNLKGYRLPTEAEWEFAFQAFGHRQNTYGKKPETFDYNDWYSFYVNSWLKLGSIWLANDYGLIDFASQIGDRTQDFEGMIHPRSWKGDFAYDHFSNQNIVVDNQFKFVTRRRHVSAKVPEEMLNTRTAENVSSVDPGLTFRVVRTIEP